MGKECTAVINGKYPVLFLLNHPYLTNAASIGLPRIGANPPFLEDASAGKLNTSAKEQPPYISAKSPPRSASFEVYRIACPADHLPPKNDHPDLKVGQEQQAR